MQLVRVEPGAVRPADIDDDPGAVCKVQAMHQFVAMRAPNVANRRERDRPADGLRAAKRRGLLLRVAADVLEGGGAKPQAEAFLTFMQKNFL